MSPVTLLMKDQVESFGSEVSKGFKYKRAPSRTRCKLMLALALRGHSSYLTPVKNCQTNGKQIPWMVKDTSKTFYGLWDG